MRDDLMQTEPRPQTPAIALATAWNPRGEINRFERRLPEMRKAYSAVAVALPPEVDPALAARLENRLALKVLVTHDWSHGRYAALQGAFHTPCSHIHYVDTDRLLRWMETRPAEWSQTVAALPRFDCLVIGRTPAAWETHPEALRQTERITNRIFSELLGQELDLSAGSKGFSRRAAAFILENSAGGHALGTDSEWIVLLHRAGFQIASRLVDGLDWETADHHNESAAGPALQREAASTYDADPRNWLLRVRVADEIVASGIAALHRKLRAQQRESTNQT